MRRATANGGVTGGGTGAATESRAVAESVRVESVRTAPMESRGGAAVELALVPDGFDRALESTPARMGLGGRRTLLSPSGVGAGRSTT